MTEKTYIKEIDRQVIYKITSQNISSDLKSKVIELFGFNFDVSIECLYFDIIRPLHSSYESVLDIYMLGSITSEIDTTKSLSVVLRRRFNRSAAVSSIFKYFDNAVESTAESLPLVTTLIVDNIRSLVSEKLSGNERKCHDMYGHQTYIFNLADNKVHTFISKASELERHDSETRTLLSTTYVSPVVVNNALRLLLQEYDGEENMRGESYTYNQLSE